MSSDSDQRHHDDPAKWCRAPLCKHTNWGGYDRLHTRGPDCPPYDPDPPRNEIAEFWESIRQVARSNAQQIPPNRPVVGPDLAKIRAMIDAQVAARGGLNALLARIASRSHD